jgi:hypothetical protein
MTISLDELIRYWHGELDPTRSAEIEEAVFTDAQIATRLEAIAAVGDRLRELTSGGRLQSTLTVRAVTSLAARGLAIRTYEVRPGQIVPCTIASEDLVVIRLHGDFAVGSRIDVVMEGTFDALPPALERYDDVAVDHEANEIVLVYPGDRIRALPRSRFRYTVRSDGSPVGEYELHHSPP